MKIVGIQLWAIGLVIVAYALLGFDPTVETYGGRVVNLGLQQQQMMIMVGGAALFIAGVLLHGMAAMRPQERPVVERPLNSTSKALALPKTIAEPDYRLVPLPRADISDEDVANQEADGKAFSDRHGFK